MGMRRCRRSEIALAVMTGVALSAADAELRRAEDAHHRLLEENRRLKDHVVELRWQVTEAERESQLLRQTNEALSTENEHLRKQLGAAPTGRGREPADIRELRADLDLARRKFLEVTELLVGLNKDKEALQARVAELEEQVLAAQRAGKRQAAPHRRSKRIPESQRKKPGRKKGHAPSWRRPPENVDRVDEIPLCGCPDCGGDLEDFQRHENYVYDLPELRPFVRKVVTHSGYCKRCRGRKRSTNPDLPTSATGAAGTVLGHMVVALAAHMRTFLGVPYGKLAAFFREILHLPVSAAGLLKAIERAKDSLTASYEAIQLALRESSVVSADETGWWLNCSTAWAWVFTNTSWTLFVIRPSRGHKVVLAVLGKDFAGCLKTDCYAAYDPLPYAKAKCIAHLLRSLTEVAALQTEEDLVFPEQAKSILKTAMALKELKPALPGDVYEEEVAKINNDLDALLNCEVTEPKNLRLANRMRKHRQHLLTFLDKDEVDATNNEAERQIRPLVLQRKISCGNRSDRGASIHEVLTSVLATARQQGKDFVSLVIQALREPLQPVFPSPPRPP